MANALVSVVSSALTNAYRRISVNWLGGIVRDRVDDATPSGVDASPIKGMTAVFAETSKANNPVIIGYIDKHKLANSGEIRIYSQDDSGELKSYVYCKKDGTININGDANHLTRYEDLKTAFDQLKSDFNALIALFNTHIHSGGTISGSTGTIPTGSEASTSTADMSAAKTNDLKIA